jgi:transketolase
MGSPLGAEEIKAPARRSAGKSRSRSLRHLDDMAHCRPSFGCKERKAWEKRLAEADAVRTGEFERRMNGDLPEDLEGVTDYKKKLAEDPADRGHPQGVREWRLR